MGNRGEDERAAIAASEEMHDEKEETTQTRDGWEVEGKLSSQWIHTAEGVPNDPKIVKAIDEWANTWASEIYPTMKDEGLYDGNDPTHVVAIEKLHAAEDALMKVLPSARFLIMRMNFDGGYVQLGM